MDKHLLTALVNKKERKKVKIKQKRSVSPNPNSRPSKKLKQSSSYKTSKSTSSKDPTITPTAKHQLDITAVLPPPEPAIKITEVNLANAPSTKKDHDYRPVMFSGCMDLESRKRLEEELAEFCQPLTEHPNQITSHTIVPAKCSWFSRSTIHSIEKTALPEFFNDLNKAKTPEIYVSYRNYIIDTYMANPQKYLTNVECRRKLPGDLCTVFRVHAFLEHWGLINYGLTITNIHKPSRLLLPHTNAHFFTLSETDSGTHPAEPQRPMHYRSSGEHCVSFRMEETDSSQDSQEVEEKLIEEELGTVGIEPLDMEMDKSQSVMIDPREWSNQEVIRLLEGVEKYTDDWNKIGEHVGSRNQDECLLYFLRLPIEEKFSDQDSALSYDGNVIPFGLSCNPVMYTMTFLASVVSPQVAASAAKAVMEVFSHLKDYNESTPDKIVERHLRDIKAAMGEETAPETPQPTSSEPTEDSEDWTSYSYSDRRVIKRALNKALEVAAAKALELAQHDELKIKAGIALLVNKQTKKLAVKLNYLESIKSKLEKDRKKLERERQVLLAKRQAYHQRVLDKYDLVARQTAKVPQEVDESEDKNLMGENPVFTPFAGQTFNTEKKISVKSDHSSNPLDVKSLSKKTDPFGFDDPTSPKAEKPNTDSPIKPESSPLKQGHSEAIANPLKLSPIISQAPSPTSHVIPDTVMAVGMEDSAIEDFTVSTVPTTVPVFHEEPAYDSVRDAHQKDYLGHDSADLFTTPSYGTSEIDMSNEDAVAAACLDFS
ncbi:SWI/SNF complex subunit SMARCC2-like [Watersipora subatra]|uniref:SWI/SNF complex subunit SMARCC2-like n=1 Tax=Watersipora subatra TaxID=2589382 RepID=UPI00355BDFDE